MSIETIIPTDEKHWLSLRKQDVTSTEVAALFGLSPYMTAFELWHRKHDNLEVEFQMNDRVRWGSRLQDSIAVGVAEDHKLTIRKATEYVRDTELFMGASFDFEITDGPVEILGPDNMTMGLEIKNVDALAFRDGWIVDGENIESPPHIEIQCQQQMMLKGWKRMILAGLIGGNRVVLIKREPDLKVIDAIKKRIKEFWESIQSHNAPSPDFQRDSDFIGRLYSYSEPGSVYNADDRVSRLAYAYKQASAEAKAASDKKDAAKAEILTLVGNAEKVVGETFTVSLGLTGPALIPAYERKGYRNFKISWKKEK